MPTKVAIQQEKEFAGNMTQLMEIMKGLALASYVKLKKHKDSRFEVFINSFDRFFHVADLTRAKNPFITSTSETLLVILVTSEESFMSGLNSKVVRLGLELVGNRPAEFIIFGKKAAGRLRSEGRPHTIFPPLKGKNLYKTAVSIKEHVLQKVLENKYGQVMGIYADPVSFSSQQAKSVSFLPAHDVYPKKMKEGEDPNDNIYQESKIDQVMLYLSEIWITNKLYMMFQDNKMSEFAAQAMQMEGSLQNLSELNRKLKIQFVKKRGEIVDSSLREIVSAILVNNKS